MLVSFETLMLSQALIQCWSNAGPSSAKIMCLLSERGLNPRPPAWQADSFNHHTTPPALPSVEFTHPLHLPCEEKNAVTAYFSIDQLPPFDSARHSHLVNMSAHWLVVSTAVFPVSGFIFYMCPYRLDVRVLSVRRRLRGTLPQHQVSTGGMYHVSRVRGEQTHAAWGSDRVHVIFDFSQSPVKAQLTVVNVIGRPGNHTCCR